jgi:nucleotide-binding universal stress UspA family protein
MMGESVEARQDAGDVPLRVLLAVQGHETAEWTTRACRLVSEWKHANVRVLGLADASCPPFTSLIPQARRLHAAARAAWIDAEEQRVQRVLDRVLRAFSRPIDVVRDRSSAGERAGVIVEHAARWAADVVVVATSPAGAPRILCDGVCAVLAIPAAPPRRATGRRFSLPWAAASKLRWAASHPAE